MARAFQPVSRQNPDPGWKARATPEVGRRVPAAAWSVAAILAAVVIGVLVWRRAPEAAPSSVQNAGAGTRPPTTEKSALAVSEKSVAVLPFENRSAEKDNEFFTDGVHDNILTSLANISQLEVVSRTSVMEYRGTKKKIPQIARELNVAYVLEGSVQRSGSTVRIAGRLIRATTDQHVWAGQFDKELTTANLFAIQSELALAIANALQAALSTSEKKLIERRPTENLAAYDLFLKARTIWTDSEDLANKLLVLRKRETLLQAAVELDPRFAPAWAEFATTHLFFIRTKADTLPERYAKAKAAIDRATSLEPDSPDVIRSLAYFYTYGIPDRTRQAEQLEKLLRVAPNDAGAYAWVSQIQSFDGRWAEALANVQRATRLDPRDAGVSDSFYGLLRRGRRFAEATEARGRVLALRPPSDAEKHFFARMNFHATGSTREMEELAAQLEQQNPTSAETVRLRITVAIWRGDLIEAIRLDRLHPTPADAKPGNAPGFVNGDGAGDMALIYLNRGDAAAAQQRLGKFPAMLRADLEREPKNTRLIRYQAGVEAVLGHKELALRHAERSVELAPTPPVRLNAREVLAQVCAIVGEKDRAIAELTDLLRSP